MLSQPRIALRDALAGAAVLGVLAIVVLARQAPPFVTDSDFAMTELYTELAARGQLAVGSYSRFGWHHPGPFYFYLQAPIYAAGGHRAMSLFGVALLINLAAILTLVAVTVRANRGLLLIGLTAVCVAMAWRAPRLLASPWVGHIAVFPALAFVAISAAIIAGRARWLPLAIVFGSFIAQTHLAFAPLAGVLGAGAIAAAVMHSRHARAPVRALLVVSALAGLILWLPPVIEALANGGGNLGALWRFFQSESATGQPLRDACAVWSYGLAGVLRPDFGLPWGGHFVLHGLEWMMPAAIAQAVLLPAIAIRSANAARPFDAAVALAAFLATVTGLWAITRIEGAIVDHEIFWLAALGALNLAIIAAAALRLIGGAWIDHAASRIARPACASLMLLTAFLGVQHLRDLTSYEMRRTTPRRIPMAYDAIRTFMRDEAVRKPVIEMQAGSWSEGAGVMLRLLQDDVPAAVTDASVPIFTRAFAPAGDEDALITISPRYGYHREQQARPGNITLLEADPVFVNAVKMR